MTGEKGVTPQAVLVGDEVFVEFKPAAGIVTAKDADGFTVTRPFGTAVGVLYDEVARVDVTRHRIAPPSEVGTVILALVVGADVPVVLRLEEVSHPYDDQWVDASGEWVSSEDIVEFRVLNGLDIAQGGAR